jgi:hypothetical protein
MRMLQPCHDLDLAQKPLSANAFGDCGEHRLDRDVAGMAAVACAVHGGHATAAKFVEQFVPL